MVPQFYLLGASKCATTTFAGDLFKAGIVSGIPGQKELHLWDDYCGVNPDGTSWCKVLYEQEKHRWGARFSQSCSSDVEFMISDMTPGNLPKTSLPETLKDLYGANRTLLRFVLILRNPLERLHAEFYAPYSSDVRANYKFNFSTFVDNVSASTFVDNVSASWGLESMLFRSMYSRNLAPWLRVFDASQFLIVPMSYYVSSLENRHATVALIQARLGVSSLNPLAIRSATQLNKGSHPTLEEDLAKETINSLQQRFFDQDARQLGQLLADGMKHGLSIAGYGGNAEAAAVQSYLSDKW